MLARVRRHRLRLPRPWAPRCWRRASSSRCSPRCESSLGGKKVALFGSYGWGDGEWMRSWEKSCDDANINLFTESVICCEAPDDDALAACTAMGKALAE